MTRTKNTWLTVAIVAAQACAQLSEELDGRAKAISAIAGAAAQAAVAQLAHSHNPDGTPAAEPYRRRRKKGSP
ncbi:MAG TPA: hypothetical protein DEH78_33290 [Solibacterales bacterium]|nr:hypothetical protein [Bryobacterales bacterium]